MNTTLVLALSALAACAAQEPPTAPLSPAAGPTRAIWVTRWDYVTRADVERVVATSADAGLDTLVFQVRGEASAFHRSALEPRARELSGADPEFDPLALALERAHARGLRVLAWVNALPAWRGSEPPSDPRHVINAHPEWLWYDAEGRRQEYVEGFYVSLNPCLPEVRAYLTAVLEEILAGYDVDGLHLDYIRFPDELIGKGRDFPRDARTLALYARDTGLAPDDDPQAWDRWRAEQVTQLVRDLRAMQRRVRPAAELGAALGADPAGALRHHQDWATWLEQGLLDAVYPMNYAAADEVFGPRFEAWRARRGAARVLMGLRVRAGDSPRLIQRARDSLAALDGFCLFAWFDLWDSPNVAIDVQTPERSAERARTRAELLPFLRER